MAQEKYLRSEQMRSQQYNTLRPHTISNSTFENKNRPLLEKNTFVPPEHKLNDPSTNHKYSIHTVPNEIIRDQQQAMSSSISSEPTKADQFQRVEAERRYSTIRRSCRLGQLPDEI